MLCVLVNVRLHQHMTCLQPSCKYQFCWECSGEYHTSTVCMRPKIKMDNNSILAFDELDRQCANHFLARKVAMRGKEFCERSLAKSHRPMETSISRILLDGWTALAEAQSALAHTCIAMLTVKSAKVTFLFETFKEQTQILQQRLEEAWIATDFSFPMSEAKSLIRDLRLRLKDFLLLIQCEAITVKERSASPNRVQRQVSRRRSTIGIASAGASGGGQEDAADGREDVSLYHDALERVQELDPAQKAALAAAAFGNAFGGSMAVYSPIG